MFSVIFALFVFSLLASCAAHQTDLSLNKDASIALRINDWFTNHSLEVDQVLQTAEHLLDEIDRKVKDWKLQKKHVCLGPEIDQMVVKKCPKDVIRVEDVASILNNSTSTEISLEIRTQVTRTIHAYMNVKIEEEILAIEEENQDVSFLEVSTVETGATIMLQETSPTLDVRGLLVHRRSPFAVIFNFFRSNLYVVDVILSALDLQIRKPVMHTLNNYFESYKRMKHGPHNILQDNFNAGECWACDFSLGRCHITISFPSRNAFQAFEVEHSTQGRYETALKEFRVYAIQNNNMESLLGEFEYSADFGRQMFEAADPVQNVHSLRLEILSNYGEAKYTCLYRFRAFI